MAPTATKERTFVVLTNALNVRAKAEPNKEGVYATLRLMRGQIAPESVFAHTDVEHLIAMKAIAVNDGEPKRATTAKAAAAAMADIEGETFRDPFEIGRVQDATVEAGDDPASKPEIDGEDAFREVQ